MLRIFSALKVAEDLEPDATDETSESDLFFFFLLFDDWPLTHRTFSSSFCEEMGVGVGVPKLYCFASSCKPSLRDTSRRSCKCLMLSIQFGSRGNLYRRRICVSISVSSNVGVTFSKSKSAFW